MMAATSCVGMRVLRGPDWDQGDSDGGEGYVGTVVQSLSNGRVRVVWDTGEETVCRAGADGKRDLRVFDSGPAGVHQNMTCSECRSADIWGMLWRCQKCAGYGLCTFCYLADKHELSHTFLRIDRADDVGQAVPIRKASVKIRAIGIFPGAKVSRGRDWMWDDQDGGQGSEGKVECYEEGVLDSGRSLLRVRWPSSVVNSYRLGFQGKVDLLCVEEETGPFYYRDHLPLLDTVQKEVVKKEENSRRSCPPLKLRHPQPSETEIEKTPVTGSVSSAIDRPSSAPAGSLAVAAGDLVAIRVNEQELEILQKDFGGCTPGMIKSIGSTGEVTSTTTRGAACVRFGSAEHTSYRFNPAGLIKLQAFREGDVVRVNHSKELAQLFNRRLGWTPEMDRTLGKVGKVLKVDEERNILVEVGGQMFSYAPACCVHEPAASTRLLPEVSSEKHETGSNRSFGVTANNKDFVELARQLITDSKTEGESETMHNLYVAIQRDDDVLVKRLCLLNPTLIECEYTEMTPMILALYLGMRNCVRALIELGADVNRCVSNNSDKTPLSAAIEGGHEDLVELLLELGANTEHWYQPGITAIHLAVKRSLPGVICALARHGAGVNRKHAGGDTPLHMAIELKNYGAAKTLLSLPEVDLNAEDSDCFTPLQLACLMGLPRAVELILERDKSAVNKKRKGEVTALHIATHNDHVECVRLLVINGGADINLGRTRKRATALHDACLLGYIATVEALLELGADVNVADVNGDTPLHLAIAGKIDNYGQGGSADVQVTCRVQIANMLISAGAFADAVNREGRKPLMYGHREVREGVTMFIKNNKSAVKLKSGGTSTGASASICGGHSNLEESLKGVGLPCGLCGDPKSDVILLPCQHKCVCSTCSDKVTCCPLCDAPVEKKVVTEPDDQVFSLEKELRLM